MFARSFAVALVGSSTAVSYARVLAPSWAPWRHRAQCRPSSSGHRLSPGSSVQCTLPKARTCAPTILRAESALSAPGEWPVGAPCAVPMPGQKSHHHHHRQGRTELEAHLCESEHGSCIESQVASSASHGRACLLVALLRAGGVSSLVCVITLSVGHSHHSPWHRVPPASLLQYSSLRPFSW